MLLGTAGCCWVLLGAWQAADILLHLAISVACTQGLQIVSYQLKICLSGAVSPGLEREVLLENGACSEAAREMLVASE